MATRTIKGTLDTFQVDAGSEITYLGNTSAGSTGGLNIRDGCWLAHQPRHPVRDMHFRLRGPVVAHLLEVFTEDWAFAADETLAGSAWAPPTASAPRSSTACSGWSSRSGGSMQGGILEATNR
mgnify:CR=1 FL=1